MMSMRKVIEIYVRNEAVPVGLEQGYYLKSPGHECTKTPVTRVVTEKVLPEVDKLALNVTEEVAKETGVELRVYDITSFKGKIKARFKGVRRTPTIIIDKNKIEGQPEKEQLISLLK